MKERPMLFSAPMVRAILEGRKTQTRRVVKGCVEEAGEYSFHRYELGHMPCCPYGVPGDRVWVRETFHHGDAWFDDAPGLSWKNCHRDGKCTWVDYASTYESDTHEKERAFAWKPSIFMPRWASRLTLEIESVRVERLNDISERDALAEGVAPSWQETWWQGYRPHPGIPGDLLHQQATGDAPPDWMIEPHRMNLDHLKRSAVDEYRTLWLTINGAGSWALNPWVWVVTFRKL